MKGVCTLDRLYRFSRHEDILHEVPGNSWVVFAGSLDEKKRMYRYCYVGDNTVEREVTISYGKSFTKVEKANLSQFYIELQQFAHDVRMAPYFRLACVDLLSEDPWLLSIGDAYGS